MKRSSTCVTFVVVTTLFVALQVAFATADTHGPKDDPQLKDTLRLEDVTLPWLFPLAHPNNSGTCAAIPPSVGSINPVDNHSDRERKITREVRADGSQEIIQDDLKTGTAVDSKGATYDFVYKNRVVLTVPPGLPTSCMSE